MWQSFSDGSTVNTVGVDGGTILKDEDTIGARITLEKDSIVAPYSITCGIYGLMVHTAMFEGEKEAYTNYEAMKIDIQYFMDNDIIDEALEEWCGQFIEKY